jgi:predicted amidophosphoribosyltransferase
LRALILAHKERGRTGLASFLGAVLADAVVLALASPQASGERGALERVVLVPVPSQPGTVRRRGNDTVASIAGACVRVLVRGGIPAERSRWLFHTRRVHDQADLDAKARSSNVVGAFAARPVASWGRPGAAVVVVDDVTTTGATLSEAVRALATAGVEVAAAATLAATVRRTEVPFPRVEGHGVTLEAASGLVRWPDRH